ncbi:MULTISPECIES: peptide-methionine (S)-S-oxide reductase MsrA [unclassified Halanaerobium]|uniref:peptide-methionine (S)-S-oxide reductase MsrA n=1 Tax=unclassified Halanaerobium TaxID=2641197 RepID=UPI000DF28514|nr:MULTISPECIES: peptide-methionine (S)-S-oxide reductase MsrA [unclassified Halanaerobium]RCW41687.1 peptide-methionine (S)-S-oxide reductase [Halanaerobium sp. MA284_MarDTE_T2]RCW78387.1 peptide-methionine (S)-S-oxide reductase [Halanaerobium sp. DL-01]
MFNNTELATLAGGCFWCLEPIFKSLKGVKKVTPGYTGGEKEFPTYKEVSSGNTGHAEAVQIKYNPQEIEFKELLEVFFSVHNPTTLNRQGADIGSQYRSAVFYHNLEQKNITERIISEIEKEEIWSDPIVTEINEFEIFYPAEQYHHNYYEKNSFQSYCQVVINPKLSKFRQKFKDKLA